VEKESRERETFKLRWSKPAPLAERKPLEKEVVVSGLCTRPETGSFPAQEGWKHLSPCNAAGEDIQVVLDSTPFYAESGGQVGDHGTLKVAGGNGEEGDQHCLIRVTDVQKAAGGSLFVHSARVESGRLQVGAQVCLPPPVP
jgi:hypothetical protein